MSDAALKDESASSAPSGQSMMLRAWQANATKPGEKIVNLLPSADGGGIGGAPGASSEHISSSPLREWSAAVDLIQEASEAIRVGEQRAAELEVQLNHVITQASEEVRRLNQQIAIGEQKLGRAEERTRIAEARASDAEAWLVRLHDAAVTAFGSRGAHQSEASYNTAQHSE